MPIYLSIGRQGADPPSAVDDGGLLRANSSGDPHEVSRAAGAAARQVAGTRRGHHATSNGEGHGGIVGGDACGRRIGPKHGCSVAGGGNFIYADEGRWCERT